MGVMWEEVGEVKGMLSKLDKNAKIWSANIAILDSGHSQQRCTCKHSDKMFPQGRFVLSDSVSLVSCSLSLMYTHARTHTHACALSHTLTHTHEHTCIHTCIHTYTHVCTLAHMCTHMHAMHGHTHTLAHTRACIHMHTCWFSFSSHIFRNKESNVSAHMFENYLWLFFLSYQVGNMRL